MTLAPRTRRRLVSALLEAPDRPRAIRIARESPDLSDEKASRLLLARFNPLPLDDRPRAGAVVRAAHAIAAVDRGPVCRAIAHRLAGILHHLDGKPALARKQLEQAVALLVAEDYALEAGDVFRILIDVLMREEDYAGARQAARNARTQYRRAGGADARRLGSLEMNLGNIHHRRDEYPQALAAYSRARRHFSRAGEELHLAIVDYNRGNVVILLDRTREARRLYASARETFVAKRMPALIAQADFALAGIDLVEGRLDSCVERLRVSRERLEQLGDRLRIAHADLDAAEAFLRLNRPADAERAARLADEYFRPARQIAESAACAGMLGGAALQKGRANDAARQFARGRRLQGVLKNPVAAALLEIGQAQAELQAGHGRRALGLARRAASALERRKLDSRQARALAVGAEAALQCGQLAIAGRWARKARNLARRRRDTRVELSAQMVLGKVAGRNGDPASSYRHLLSAERCVEKLRRGITTEESRLAFALDKTEVYEALILNRLERGDPQSIRQALTFAERGKARALAERLSEGQIAVLGADSPRTRELLEKLSVLEQELALVESRLQDPGSTSGMRGARVTQFEALTRARMKTLDRLTRRDPDRAAMVGAPLPDPLEHTRSLAPDELVLEYTRAGDDFHLFLIERDRIEAVPRLVPADRLIDLIDLLRFQLSKGVLGESHSERFGGFIEATVRGYLEKLHEMLLGPVEDRLHGKRLRIIPHDILHGLPFHALERSGSALIDRNLVSYAPSLTTVGLLSRRRKPSGAPPLVLGVPDRSAPLIRNEVEAVQRHAGGARVFRGERATRQALRLSESQPALLHVACHGFYCEDGPWSGGLRLGDNWLSLPDLYGMKGMADLVVLSGCETGRGTVHSGDEWVGLVRGFLQAGARAVVASLWEVHDGSTVELMEDFYGRLAAGSSVAEALALAQRRARDRDPMPLRWAPFIVFGEPGLKISLRKVA